MMAGSGKRIYLCEGETERHLVRALVQARLIRPGRAELFNAAQKKAEKYLRKWGRDAVLTVIIDGDTGPYDDAHLLARNLQTIARKIRQPGLIVQCMNLEDELARSCGITPQQLYRAFKAASASEFKQRFLQVRQTGLMAKLQALNFQPEQLWREPCRDSRLQGSLADWPGGDVWP